jgi:SAM-dependent methyltransferase
MNDEFDKAYWETHWQGAAEAVRLPAHPALETEIAGLPAGVALDAGSGEGAEALWLAARGWDVTAVDISAEALRAAAERAPGEADVTWIEADLTTWEPGRSFDLVTTFYAHPTIPQLAFYERIARWVAPGGTLLIVGHDSHGHSHGHGYGHPDNAVTAPDAIRALLDADEWVVQTAEVRERTVGERHGHGMLLRDVVVRALRS